MHVQTSQIIVLVVCPNKLMHKNANKNFRLSEANEEYLLMRCQRIIAE